MGDMRLEDILRKSYYWILTVFVYPRAVCINDIVIVISVRKNLHKWDIKLPKKPLLDEKFE